MGLLDRILGRPSRTPDATAHRPGWDAGSGGAPWQTTPTGTGTGAGTTTDADAAALERYRYLLRTAPPDRIEEAHAEAFARLTPEQRRAVLEGLAAEVPPGERARSDDPRELARMATRAEVRQPGTLERAFARPGVGGFGGAGVGLGGVLAGSLLASVAGAFIGTAIADAMFGGLGDAYADGYGDGYDDGGDGGGDGGDVTADGGGGFDDGGFDGGGFDGGGFDGGFDGGF